MNFFESHFYGISQILKEYSRVPKHWPLPAQVQHGWYYNAVGPGDDVRAPEIWCWSRRIAADFRENFPAEAVRVIGSPFLYLVKNKGIVPYSLAGGSGTLVLPSHSSEQLQASYDQRAFVSALQDLPLEYHPITVCIYYTDLAYGHDKPFRDAGFEIVTSGKSRTDANFLSNFIELACGNRFLLSNQMTSGLLFGAYLGLIPMVFGPEYRMWNTGNRSWSGLDINQVHRDWIRDFASHFDGSTGNDVVVRPLVEHELGVADMLSAEEMQILFFRLLRTHRFPLWFFRSKLSAAANSINRLRNVSH